MKPLDERINDCFTFLESVRPGYTYSVIIRRGNSKSIISPSLTPLLVSVVGESYQDKSLPHIFLSVKLEGIEQLPESVMVESQKLVDSEVESKRKSIESLQKEIEKLMEKGKSLQELQEKLKTV